MFSLLADAPKRGRPLLLMHGLAHDNVFVTHTPKPPALCLAAENPQRCYYRAE